MMIKFLFNNISKLSSSNQNLRKLILIILDISLLIISTIVILWLNNFFINGINFSILKFIFVLILIVPLYYDLSNQYSPLSRYIGAYSFYKSLVRNFFLIILLALINKLFGLVEFNLKTYLLLFFGYCISTISIRIILRDLIFQFQYLNKSKFSIPKVIIYGAGDAGAQLANSIRTSNKFKILMFIDENPKLWRRSLYGISINSPDKLKMLTTSPDYILLAIPSATIEDKKRIIKSINELNLSIMRIPSVEEITTGKLKIDNLIPIDLDDLLFRESKIEFTPNTLTNIGNSCVCITGAGGSIGSELSRQLLSLNPIKILLIDNSEYNLYKICQEVKNINNKNTKIYSFLGDICNYDFLKQVFCEHKIDLVFHAAAYKHVPLVEENPIEGIYNNVVSTKNICEACLNFQARQLIMISTDKAVRPTNIMGASKRLAELIAQGYSLLSLKESKSLSKFSMVRFGNVIGSSGSVVPLFKKQILDGGPITLTDENITRYFMSIKEAAKLVIEASSLLNGGDVFLLDMGKPLKVKDLAEQLVLMSGLSIKNKSNPNGDIEIKITGLRKGEKLYEELLIDAKAEETSNPLIFRANEKFIDAEVLFPQIQLLENCLKSRNLEESLKILKKLVPEWEKS